MSNKTNYNYKKEEWKIIECKLGLRLGLNSNFLKFQSFTIQLTVSSKNLLDTTIFFYLLLRVYWIAILTEAKMLNFLLIKKKKWRKHNDEKYLMQCEVKVNLIPTIIQENLTKWITNTYWK